MLIQDTTEEPTTTATAHPEIDPPDAIPPSRRGWRRASVLAAAGTFVAIAAAVAITASDRELSDTASVSDGSFEVAEANRVATLRDISAQRMPDGSHDQAEANRMATLRDLAASRASDDSHDQAEANRMATLQDLGR